MITKTVAFLGIFVFIGTSAYATTTKEWDNPAIPKLPAQQTNSGVINNNQQLKISGLNEGSGIMRSLRLLVGDQKWLNPNAAMDAVFENLGYISIGFKIFDSKHASFKGDFVPSRSIFFYNTPVEKTLENDKATFKIPDQNTSHYIVVSSLTSVIKGDFTLTNDLVRSFKGSSLNLSADTGIQISYAQNVDSPRVLNHGIPGVELSKLNFSIDESTGNGEKRNDDANAKDQTISQKLAADGYFANASGAVANFFNKIEAGWEKGLKLVDRGIEKADTAVIDQDTANVFFKESFEALNLKDKLPFTRETFTEMNVGDILTTTVFASGGPGILFKKGILEGRVEHYYRVAYSISFKKLSEHEIQAIPLLQYRPGVGVSIDTGVSWHIIRIGNLPFYASIGLGAVRAWQTLMKFDISNPQEFDALMGISQFNFFNAFQLIKNGSKIADTSDHFYRSGNNAFAKMKLNLGIAHLTRSRSREVLQETKLDEHNRTLETSNWNGDVATASETQLNFIKWKYDNSTRTDSKINLYLNANGDVSAVKGLAGGKIDDGTEITPADDHQIELPPYRKSIVFFNPAMTSESLESRLRYIKYATGIEGDILDVSTRTAVDDYYKKNKKGKESLILTFEYDVSILGAALKMDKDAFWNLIWTSIMDDPRQALTSDSRVRSVPASGLTQNDRVILRQEMKDLHWNARCKVKPVLSLNAKLNPEVFCKKVWLLADEIGSKFEAIKDADNDKARVNSLTKLIYAFPADSALINYLFVEAYKKANNGASAPVDYFVRLDGAHSRQPFTKKLGEKVDLPASLNLLALDEVNTISLGDARLKNGLLYYDAKRHSKKAYVMVESPITLTDNQYITLWLQQRHYLRDEPMTYGFTKIDTRTIKPEVIVSTGQDSLLRYEIQIPDEMLARMQTEKHSMQLDLRFENPAGEPISEFGQFDFNQKDINLGSKK